MPDFSGGPTQSVPVNTVVGATPALVSNAAVSWSTGDPSLTVIAAGVNIVVDWIKNWKHFPEQLLTVPLVIVLSFLAAFLIWHYAFGDNYKAVVNGFGILTNAHFNYGGIKATGLGLLGPTQPQNKFGV